MACKFTIRQVNGVYVIDCVGTITIGEAADGLRDHIRRLASRTDQPLSFQGRQTNVCAVRILVNLSEVSHTDSSGIDQLVSSFALVNNQGGRLRIFGANKKFADIIRNVIKLGPVFEKKGLPETYIDATDEATALRNFQE